MKKYKIISSNKQQFSNSFFLLRNITKDSEIWDISELGKELYLGRVSEKALCYIATEIAEYTLNNYCAIDIHEGRECIRLCKKYIELDGPASDSEISRAVYYATNKKIELISVSSAACLSTCVLALRVCLLKGCDDLIDKIGFRSNYAAFHYYKDMEPYRESLRQEAFIIDFLKSDKSLFMV
jgi:hypothetical protein